MVFDGMANTSKAGTEKKRKESRSQAKNRARELMIEGKTSEAKKEFDKAVEIKHEHALALMEACRAEGVDCLTSMYEADAQLAYLNKIGLADYVISEDSDLILFGCTKIVFKLTLDGSCVLFDSKNLHKSLNCSQEKFSFEKFRRIAIMSGCDYLDSLHGIGLAKATKFLMRTAETDMRRALLKMPSYLNMPKLNVTPEYIEGFLKAEATFKYMYVYDPLKRKMVRLNEIEDEEDEQFCSQTGQLLRDEEAYQLALGNINPRTFEVVADFDPNKPIKSNCPGAVFNPSIWTSDFNEFKKQTNFKPNSGAQSRITSFVPVERVADVKIRDIIERENKFEEEIGMYGILNAYSNTSTSTKVSFHSENNSRSSSSSSTSKNPFAVKKIKPETPLTAEQTSLINFVKSAKTQQKSKVVSRYFKSEEEEINPLVESTAEELEKQAKENSKLMKEEVETRLEDTRKFYQLTKYSFQKAIDSEGENRESKSDEDVEDAVEVISDEEVIFTQRKVLEPAINSKPIRQPKSFTTKLSLKRKSSTSASSSNSQSKLAKFGFVRKTK